MPLLARQTSRNKTLRHLRGEKTSVIWSGFAYPFSFLQKLIKIGKPNNSAEPADEFKANAVLPSVKGLSEQLRRCLQQQGVRAVFKSETTLRSQLIRPKDAVDPAKQERETGRPMQDRPMQDRIKEHDRQT